VSSRDVGLLGGSFDPVHEGHLDVARRAIRQFRLAGVWFVIARRPPHKPAGSSADAVHRVAMLELAVASEPGMKVCKVELERGGPRYTIDTVRTLRSRHPDQEFWLLLGEDSFRNLGSWRQPQRLLELAAPIVCPRPGYAGERPARWRGIELRWLEGAPIDLSSTSLRQQIAAGERPAGVPSQVLDYVRRHSLYEGESGS